MATLQDVATAAGVSPTTVSRYLNGRIVLPAPTAARIDEAIARLDYRPNVLAKRLSTGRAEAIGLVTPEIRNTFFAELASAVEDEAERHGYTVLIASTRGDRQREIAAMRKLEDRHVDGLIMMTNTEDDGTLAALISQQRNVVVIDNDIPGASVPRILVENDRGAYEATRHLIDAGHQDIAFIGGPPGLTTADERRRGYQRALTEAGIPVNENYMRSGLYNEEVGRRAVADLLASAHPPTAVFASSNVLVIGAVTALRQAGLAIPDDVSIIGFDDMPSTRLLQPALTTVRQPVDTLGRQGFSHLLALLKGEEVPALTLLPVTLMRRGSVAAPKRRPRLVSIAATGA